MPEFPIRKYREFRKKVRKRKKPSKRPVEDRWSYTRSFKRSGIAERLGVPFYDREYPLPEEDIYARKDREPSFIIERDTPVIGGVWASKSRENIWVAPNDPDFKKIFWKVIRFIEKTWRSEPRSLSAELKIVDKAHEIVKQEFKEKRNLRSIDREEIIDSFREVPFISIWTLFRLGVDKCRHQAVVLAAVLQKLQEEDYLGGRISLDRSRQAHGGGGHAWVRYTDTSGTIWIMDLSKHFNNSLEKAFEIWKKDHHAVWPYWRPEDVNYLNAYWIRKFQLKDLR